MFTQGNGKYHKLPDKPERHWINTERALQAKMPTGILIRCVNYRIIQLGSKNNKLVKQDPKRIFDINQIYRN
jgi:hypothetical protein